MLDKKSIKKIITFLVKLDPEITMAGLENSMDRGAWRATDHGVTKNWTGLSDFHFQDPFHNPSWSTESVWYPP